MARTKITSKPLNGKGKSTTTYKTLKPIKKEEFKSGGQLRYGRTSTPITNSQIARKTASKPRTTVGRAVTNGTKTLLAGFNKKKY